MARPEKKFPEEFELFKNFMTNLMAVPHSAIKARLDEEEATRKRKRTRKAKVAAFRASNDKN
jgi:hypothetical protein